METKEQKFEALLFWLMQEQKELTELEMKVDSIYKNSGSDDSISLTSYEFMTLEISLDTKRFKVGRIKDKLKKTALSNANI